MISMKPNNGLELLGEGSTAYIYKLDDLAVLKQYKDVLELLEGELHYKMDPDVFKVLSTINYTGFTTLYEMFNRYYDISGYTAKYEKSTGKKLKDMDDDYILDSLHNIDKISEILTGECIAINDCNAENTIVTPECLTIIDTDMYRFTRNTKALQVYNKQKARDYVLNKLFDGRMITDVDQLNKIHDNFEFNIDPETDLAHEVKSRTKGKRIGSYFE